MLWDLLRRQSFGAMVANDGGFVTSRAFSTDGRWLVSGEDDGSVVWDLRPDTWISRACAAANRNLTESEWKQLIGDNPAYRQTCP